jgi:hypothetical protein
MAFQNNYGFYGDIPDGVTVANNVTRALEFSATHSPRETVEWFFDVFRNNRDQHLPLGESMDYKQLAGC